MKDEQTTCTPCEQNFEDNINELVDQVEDYTRKDRMRKEREVEEAFAADKEPKRLPAPPQGGRQRNYPCVISYIPLFLRLCGNGYLYLVLLYDINVYLHVNSLNNE